MVSATDPAAGLPAHAGGAMCPIEAQAMDLLGTMAMAATSVPMRGQAMDRLGTTGGITASGTTTAISCRRIE
jgi:hypothetical protein